MLKETWPNYRRVNRLRLDGIPFHDIADQMDDTEEHIYDFWERFHTYKQEQKKKWDKENYKYDPEKYKAYRDAHKDEINAKARQDRKDNPEKYREWYQRRKKRASERGIQLNDPKYRREYYLANRDRLIQYTKDYVEEHHESVSERAHEYYIRNRQRILDYHVQYYQNNKVSRIEQLILDGKISAKCDVIDTILSSYALRVMDILNRNHIRYTTEKKYDGCIDKRKLPFDFFLSDYNILIEVDGEQHFYPINFGGRKHSEDDVMQQFETILRHDAIKTKYAEDNHIPLIRIPYYLFDENLEDYLINEIKKNIV